MTKLIERFKAPKLIIITGLLMFVFGCSTDISEYKNTSPTLSLEQFFNGKLTAAGIVENYSGKVTRTFTVIMDASWQGNKGIIDEDFIFNDGETQKRIWTITNLGSGKYQGSAGDIIGIATGQSEGNALRWKYDMSLVVDDETYEVHFDDWMFLVDDNTIINRSDIKKFGITVGRVILVIQKT